MSEYDRSQVLQEIDFCRGKIPQMFERFADGPRQAKAPYRQLLEASFIMLDAAVTRLLIIEGIDPLPNEPLGGSGDD